MNCLTQYICTVNKCDDANANKCVFVSDCLCVSGEKLHGAPGDFAPEMQKRALN